MTTRAADDFPEIGKRMAELAKEREDNRCTCLFENGTLVTPGMNCPVHGNAATDEFCGLRPGVYRLTADDVRTIVSGGSRRAELIDRIRASIAAAHFRVER